MVNIGQLSETVQKNCHISDARHAGSYSMCIFLLKMREYYRWERGLSLTQEIERSAVGDWMVNREQDWERYEDQPYEPLALECGVTDPFDADTINTELVPQGYVYSSGYGLYNKPHFFLGKLDKQETHDGIRVLISDQEYARDLVAPPAMILNNTIFIRTESLRRVIWEKIEEWQWKRDARTPMARVLSAYANEQDLEMVLDDLCKRESRNVILHELGEARAGKLLGSSWEEMLANTPRSKAELLLRSVRDHLADCLSTLPSLIENKNDVSLHFYFANLTSLRKEIFPKMMRAYDNWVETGSYEALAQVADKGGVHWREQAFKVLDAHRVENTHFVDKIDDLVLPL